MKLSSLIILTFLITLFSSCEKKIDFKLAQSEPKLVVEATIENGGPPVVFLSNSFNYFSTITPDILANSFVHNAIIKVSDGVKTHTLKEYSIPVANGYNLYYYSTDSANLSTAITGQLKTSYSINIETGGRQYTAKTTIPGINKQVDSIWWKPVPADTSKKEVLVMIKVTDPPGFGDYVRYWTKRNSEPFLPGFNSVYDDYVIDGTTYELAVEPGIDRNSTANEYNIRSFKRGDTVTLKLSSIDKATYDFWRTMEYTYASVGNPFSSPVKVINNISNGALGYFGGYASQYHTLIIPR
jgi:hypothetical protein